MKALLKRLNYPKVQVKISLVMKTARLVLTKAIRKKGTPTSRLASNFGQEKDTVLLTLYFLKTENGGRGDT